MRLVFIRFSKDVNSLFWHFAKNQVEVGHNWQRPWKSRKIRVKKPQPTNYGKFSNLISFWWECKTLSSSSFRLALRRRNRNKILMFSAYNSNGCVKFDFKCDSNEKDEWHSIFLSLSLCVFFGSSLPRQNLRQAISCHRRTHKMWEMFSKMNMQIKRSSA